MAIEKLNKTYVNNQTKLNATDFQENVDKIDEIIDNFNEIVLWENEDSSLEFNSQTITLNSSDYDYYSIDYRSINNSGFYQSTGKIKKGDSTILSVNMNVNGSLRIATRKINYTNDNTLNISIAEYSTPGGSLTTNNAYLVPTKIVGTKTHKEI